MAVNGVLGQGLRLFTVEIRRTGSDKPVGTGFIISPLGVIATCRHVLRETGMDPDTGKVTSTTWDLIWNKQHEELAKVDVYIPKVKEFGVHREGRAYKAVFKACPHPPFGDDVALLQLESVVPELTPQEVAIIGEATGSEGNEFESFGYRTREEHKYGLPARGFVLGPEGQYSDRHRSGETLHKPSVVLESQGIKGGMSGSAVLDVKRNLVIGIIKSEYDSGKAAKDRDLCFAVDAAVLAKPPLDAPIHPGALPRIPIRLNSIEIKVDDVRAKNPGISLNGAAQVVEEWVERSELSELMNSTWADDRVRLVALIGFGGSGKSSLARRWLESLRPKPEAVFWWNWNLKPNADEFFEAAVRHFTDNRIDLSDYTSSLLRARLLARLLEGGRYLFVLDGLESMQHQSGDLYGNLRNEPLREFLTFFAGSSHQSFCLITSRAPVADLGRVDAAFFRWYEVDCLTRAEGKALLRQFDIRLPDMLLDEIVDNWRGHALSLALIGGQLRLRGHENKNVMPHEIPVPEANVTEGDRVRSLLRDYDKALTDDERAALFSVSMFRTAVPVTAVRLIFPEMLQKGSRTSGLDSVLHRLLSRRLIQRVNDESELTEHPLILEYYHELLLATRRELGLHIHNRIGEFYSNRAVEPSKSPQLPELADWIEAAYHFCRADQYNRAYHVYYDKLEQGNELVLSWKLNAYSTIAGILEHFFPGNVTSEDPLVEDVRERRFLINRLGVCRMNLGRLREAPPLFERAVTIAEEADILKDHLHSSENLVEVYSYLGSLNAARRHAANAVRLAQDLGEADELRDALAYDAWIAHLTGNIEAANTRFAEAERVEASIDAANPYLTSLYGIWHADHLRRIGNLVAAKSQVERVFEHARSEDMLDDISQGWRLLGDIASACADHDTARKCYAEALKLARNMSEITVLLEALLARGRWAATADAEEARSDLDEALHYAQGGSYGLYEADVRIGLARVKNVEGDKNGAIREAQRAQELAAKSHYYWAEHESEALIAEISKAIAADRIHNTQSGSK